MGISADPNGGIFISFHPDMRQSSRTVHARWKPNSRPGSTSTGPKRRKQKLLTRPRNNREDGNATKASAKPTHQQKSTSSGSNEATFTTSAKLIIVTPAKRMVITWVKRKNGTQRPMQPNDRQVGVVPPAPFPLQVQVGPNFI